LNHNTPGARFAFAFRRAICWKGAPGRPALLAFATLLAMLGATGAAQTAAAQTAAAQSGGATVQRPLAVGARLGPLGQAPQDLTANCLQWVTAPASVDHSLVDGVCADVVSDLAGIGARLGLPVLAPTSSRLTDPLAIVFAPTNVNGKTLAVTGYFNGVKHHLSPGSPEEGFIKEPCQITLYPLLYSGEHASLGGVSDRLHVLLSHEVVHCYQDKVFSEAEISQTVPAFITEGSATYLATSYAGYGEPGTASFWSQGWLGIPGRDLTARNYDAVGWYSLVAHITGNDLWSKMVDAWRAYESGGSSAFISTLGGDSVPVEKAWGASMVNQPTWGDEWTTPGIGVPMGARPAVVADVLGATGGSNGGTLQPWAAVIDQESSVPDGLLEISVSGGYASVHDGSGHSALGFTDAVFCVGSRPCQDTDVSCTSGGTPLNLAPLAAPFTLAVNSTAADARYTITSIASPGSRTTPLDLPPSAGDCNPAPGNGTAVAYSEGDPHLATFNDGALDFQAAGEYTLVESRDHSLEVQVREQPVNGSSSVAEDTAVAMLVAGTRIEVDGGTGARLLVNGAVAHLEGTAVRSLPGGGSVHADAQGDIFVKWPDRCSAAIESFPGGLNVFFGAPQPLVEGLHGLLNSVVTGASPLATDTVLIGGNGKRYLVDPSTNSGFRTIYSSFAPSWAVTEKDSLFTYPPGKNPSSYLVKGFPASNYDAATVPALLLPLYESQCRAKGVTNGNLLRGCVIDQSALGTKYINLVLRAVVRAFALYTLTEGPVPQSRPSTSGPPPTPASTSSTVPPKLAGGPTLPTDVSQSIVETIVKHPCTLLTEAQADAAAGTHFATQFDLAATGLCEYVANPPGNSTINVYVQRGSVAQDLPPKFANTFVPEPTLGGAVVWVVEKGGAKGSGELWFPLGQLGSESYSVQISVAQGGLPEAATIARDCFSHM
jgi:hypothetical protein